MRNAKHRRYCATARAKLPGCPGTPDAGHAISNRSPELKATLAPVVEPDNDPAGMTQVNVVFAPLRRNVNVRLEFDVPLMTQKRAVKWPATDMI